VCCSFCAHTLLDSTTVLRKYIHRLAALNKMQVRRISLYGIMASCTVLRHGRTVHSPALCTMLSIRHVLDWLTSSLWVHQQRLILRRSCQAARATPITAPRSREYCPWSYQGHGFTLERDPATAQSAPNYFHQMQAACFTFHSRTSSLPLIHHRPQLRQPVRRSMWLELRQKSSYRYLQRYLHFRKPLPHLPPH